MAAYITGEQREELRREAVKKYKLGKSVRMVAEELGRSYGATYALLKQSGVEMRDRGYRSDW